MKYFREYLVAVLTKETVERRKAGIDSDESVWMRIFIDFATIECFNELPGFKDEISVNFCNGECYRLQITFDNFKRDFQSYLEIYNKSIWLCRQ